MYKIKLFLVTATLLCFSTFTFAQNPAGIGSQPLLWLKADAGVSTSEGKVTSWADQSGHGHDAIQTNSALQPEFANNTLSAVQFDGVSELVIPAGILGTETYEGFEMIVVASLVQSSSGYLFRELSASGQLFGALLPWDGNIYFDHGNRTGNRINVPTPSDVESIGVYDSFAGLGESAIMYSGTTLIEQVKAIDSTTGAGYPFYLGSFGGDHYHHGKIYEVILFPARISDEERNAVTSYLSEKYGIVKFFFEQIQFDKYQESVDGIIRRDLHNINKRTASSNLISIDTPSDLDDLELLTIAHNEASYVYLKSGSLPAGYLNRTHREWRIGESGDVGNVNLEIDLSYFKDFNLGKMAMLIDDDGNYSNAQVIPLDSNDPDFVFNIQRNLNHGDFISFAFAKGFSYPIKSLDPFTLRNGVPDHFFHEGGRWDGSDFFEEWVYWERNGPNPWQVVEKMNMRLMPPKDYDPNKPGGYPVIFFFTGCGESGRSTCTTNYSKSDPRYDNNDQQLGPIATWFGGTHATAILKDEDDMQYWDGFAIAFQADYSGWENGILEPNASSTMISVQNTMEALFDKFNINRNRVAAHGFSNGGKAVWDLANRRPDLVSSILPMSAVGDRTFADQMGHMPIWQFQGEKDLYPPAAASRGLRAFWDTNGGNYKYTEYPEVGHFTWPPAYASPDFFEWMRNQDQRNIHVYFGETDIPTAGGSVKLGIAPGHLEYKWYRNGGLIANTNSNNYTATNTGDYTVAFKRYNGEWETSFATTLTGVVVNNQPPVAAAGNNQTITLPTNSVSLNASASTDRDGTITNYQWQKISGPAGSFSNSNASAATFSGLVEGTYQIRLTVTDNDGAADEDQLTITVNPADPGGGGGGGTAGDVVYRVNVGGSQINDVTKNWITCKSGDVSPYFIGNARSKGWTNNNGYLPNNTNGPNGMYSSYRYVATWANMEYAFPVTSGSYFIRLYFGENATATAGQRVFDVEIEGRVELSNLDIFAEVGKGNPLEKEFNISVTDGTLNLKLLRKSGDPVLSGIEILASTGGGGGGAGAANVAPVASAGSDKAIILPTNSVTLSGFGTDSDGSIATYGWTKISGPNIGTIASPNQAQTNVTNLAAGTYLYRFRVTDNEGAIDDDHVQVVVNQDVLVGGNGTVIYRVNAGGSQLTGSPINWSTDTKSLKSSFLSPQSANATTGWNYNNPANSTDAPGTLFGTHRYGPSWGGNVKYSFPVNNGTYDVRLYFAEKPFSNTSAGARKFDVEIEGSLLLINLDVAAEIGSGTTQKNFQTVISDGSIDIELKPKQGTPIISGIEILSPGGQPVPVFQEIDREIIGSSEGLVIYPNPGGNLLNLDFSVGAEDETVVVKLRDTAGKLIYNHVVNIKPGDYHLQIDFTEVNLSDGMYFFHLETKSFPNQLGKWVKKE